MRALTLLAASACLGAVLPAHAQTTSVRGPTRVGLLAGVNVATFGGSDTEDAESHVGFVGGVYLSLPLTPSLSFRPELLYSMKGAEVSATEDGVSASGKVKVDYVELPLLLAADLPVSGSVVPQLYAGPSLALKTGCTVELATQGVQVSGSCEGFSDDGSGLKTFDLGFMFGGAFKFDLKNDRAFSIGARYTLGLTDIADGADTKNRALGIVGSIEIPLARH